MIANAYDDRDSTRESEHDELRQIRLRWIGDEALRWLSTRPMAAW